MIQGKRVSYKGRLGTVLKTSGNCALVRFDTVSEKVYYDNVEYKEDWIGIDYLEVIS